MKRIYFDYAATTPLDPEALEAMLPYFGENLPARHARQRAGIAGWGNPGSLHSFGQEAMAAIDGARETIAESIGANFREIIFTGSATEANNLVLRGVIGGLRRQALGSRGENLKPSAYNLVPRVIVSAIEHESILETARDLEQEGVEVIYLSVDKNGFVDLEKLKESLNERTILVSIMYANNEIGTIQPIAEISKIIRNFRDSQNVVNDGNVVMNNSNKRAQASDPTITTTRALYPLFHTDAVQAFQYLDCDVNKLGVDLMTLSAHKIYGPKGVGALYVRNVRNVVNVVMNGRNKRAEASGKTITTSRTLQPLITGGGQEFGLRSGTENVPAIAGFAKAVTLATGLRETETKRIFELRDYFWQEIKKIEPKAETNGCNVINVRNDGMNNLDKRAQASGKTVTTNRTLQQLQHLPGIFNVYFPGVSSADLLIKLDMAGIAVSSGSACSVRSPKPSHVLGALGLPPEHVKNSLRFSFGRLTTKEEIDEALKILNETLNG